MIIFAWGKAASKGKKFVKNNRAFTLSDVMKEKSTYCRSSLKRRLLKENLLENKYAECGLKDIWNDKPINMQIDYINGIVDNGIVDNHRLDNLRMICPNCHSQTPIFSGKNIRVSSIDKMGRSERLEDGLIPSSRTNWRNNPRLNKRKVVRPLCNELHKLLWQMPTYKIAKQFGVSDKAIEKWTKSYGLSKLPRGYWQKVKSQS